MRSEDDAGMTTERHGYPIMPSVYTTTPSHLGDLASCPLQYFRLLRDGREVRTMHLHVRHEWKKFRRWPTIFGGGGLLWRWGLGIG